MAGLNLDQHISILDLQRIDRDLHGRILRRFAGGGIPLPAMPGADEFATIDHSLPQGPAAVQADVIHGAVDSVNVGDADGLFSAGKFLGFVRSGKVGLGGEFGEWHGIGALSIQQVAFSQFGIFDAPADSLQWLIAKC